MSARLLPTLALLAAPLLGAAQPSSAGSPEATVRAFVARINAKDLRGAAGLVLGGKPNADYSMWIRQSGNRWPKFVLSGLRAPRQGNSATASYTITAGGTGARPRPQKETLSLTLRNGRWLIVPTSPQTKSAMGSYLGMLGFAMANPAAFNQARRAAYGTMCLSNVKQLALAFIMFASDHDDTLKLTPARARAAVRPYHKSDALWRCPSGGTYAFNAALAGKSLNGMREPANTVLLYEGRGGKLEFRHDGKATIGFVDGSAKRLTREEAKKLRWKP